MSRTIVTHLLSWNSDWIKIVEFTNRMIRGMAFSRNIIKEAFERNELSNSWIYFLFWEDENEKSLVYIGQALDIWKRLKDHLRSEEKNFWNYTICFTKWNKQFDSAEVNFLEWTLIKKAKDAWKYEVINSTIWNKEHVDEFKINELDEFISDLEILIWTLSYPVLTPYVRKNTKWEVFDNENKKESIYFLKRPPFEAKMVYTNEWTIVLEWSTWKQLTDWGLKDGIWKRREKLEKQDIIKINQDWSILFLKDYLFKTPSGAAMIVAWNTLNGWWEWKDSSWVCLWENKNYWQSNN